MLCLPSWYAQGTQQAQKSVSDRHNKKHSTQKIMLLHPLCLSSKAGKADVLHSLQTAAVPDGGGGGGGSAARSGCAHCNTQDLGRRPTLVFYHQNRG